MQCPKCQADLVLPALPEGDGRVTIFVDCPCKASVRLSTHAGWERWYATAWEMILKNQVCPRQVGPDREAFYERASAHLRGAN